MKAQTEFKFSDAPGWHRLWWIDWPPIRWQWTCSCGFFVKAARRAVVREEKNKHTCVETNAESGAT